jgi:Ca2+-binding RTX toxin-like protein
VAPAPPPSLGSTLLWHTWGSYGPDLFNQHCGAATIHNTDDVYVLGNAGSDSFTLAQREHGRERAYFAGTGIVFHLDLDQAGPGRDKLDLDGTAQADTITVGQSGVALDLVGTVAVLEAPLEFVQIRGRNRNDVVSGQGGNGTGIASGFRLVLLGGAGHDTLTGGLAGDQIEGGNGHDGLDGSAGRDHVAGNGGDDTLSGRDGERDIVDGGRGVDRAQVDDGIDAVSNVESFF